jgi:hypothetical protein
MKINVISDTKIRDANIDFEVIHFMVKKIKGNIELAMQPVNAYKIEKKATINFFINCANYNFFKDAKLNIALIDHTIITKNVLEYLPLFDYVIVKDNYSKSILESYTNKFTTKPNYVCFGWGSPSITEFTSNKNFDKVLMYIPSLRDDIFNRIIDAWKPEYPTLEIVGGERIRNKREANNINFNDNITNEGFHKLFNEIGFHLIPEKYNGFSHFVNQCKQVGAVPICLDTSSNKEIVNSEVGYLIPCKRAKVKNKSLLDNIGPTLSLNIDSITNTLDMVFSKNVLNHQLMSKNNITDYNKYYNKFSALFKDTFDNIVKRAREIPKPATIKLSDSDLPSVSIITPTFNRPEFFKLAILNFNSFEYPRDKIEWIIVDDSDNDETEKQLPPAESRGKYNINYIRPSVQADKLMSIGEKRNLAIRNSKNDIIVCMDDDDYYYPEYLKNRVTSLVSCNKNKNTLCTVCTHLGTFEFTRIISMIYSPKSGELFKEQIAPNTLVFYREFFDEENGNNFEDCSRGEAEQLIGERLHVIEPVSWENNVVTLLHSNNIRDIYPPQNQETNGSHFKFKESVFKFITSIGKKKEQLKE